MQIGWVRNHLADLRADFMRFFPQLGVDPFAALDGPTFFELAERVAAFGGVMTARVRALDERAATTPALAGVEVRPRHGGSQGAPSGAQVVELAALQVMAPDLIERSRANG